MSGSVRTAVRRASVRRRRWWPATVATTVPAVVTALALLYPGVPVSQVDLNDGAVWLTNTAQSKLGRYNPQIDELNAGLVNATREFDVLQDAGDVLLVEPGKVSAVDPASVTFTARATVPLGSTVWMSAGTVAVVDAERGGIWVGTVDELGALSVDQEDPAVPLSAGGTGVVAQDGIVLAADADGTLRRATVGEDGVVVSEDGALAGTLSGPISQVTAVGTQLVALAGSTLHAASGSVDLTAYGPDLVLQQPGPDASRVLVASPTALLEVPLGRGRVSVNETGGSGRPAAPVVVGACGHGAWASATASHLQLCGDAGPVVTDLEGTTTDDELVFRVNRDVVVLNDTRNGRLWVPLEDPRLREPNWQDVEPQEETEDTEQESETRESSQIVQSECTTESAAPMAADDVYGVRAGRTAILSVIDNDGSSDCGILAISEHDQLPPEFGVLVPIYGGRAFQLTTEPGARGTVDFTYTVTDGRGTSAPSTATVELTVRPAGENSPPEQLRVGAMVVEQGGSATYDVLPDFRDPDGDPLILSGASIDGGGSVRTRQDGRLTFTSDGGALGRRTVAVQVSDGTASFTGAVYVDVRPVGSLAPLIDPVHAVTYVGEPIVVRPLDSVRSLSREPARLAAVEEVRGATLSTDLTAGTFTFSAAGPGTYYVPFLVAAPPQQATGVARIDVEERPDQTPPPTAVLDVALLPPGGEVTIDPLRNDVDPAGGVLVLQSVEVPQGTGLRVAVLQHQLLRISSNRVLDAPVTATYTISNGTATATGEVLIQPIAAAGAQQAPVVPNVTATVRTDGVVTIPVLDGAYDADGDALTLVRELVEPLGPGQGLLFVSGDVLRYQAPSTPMEVRVVFNVSDPAGNETAATLTVAVHASDATTKTPPRPLPLTARVFGGETIRIPVPLIGIDRDGDGVYLLGQDEPPGKGLITAVGPDWMEYRALPGELGTDTFSYAVEDWVGQRSVATVRVGIAARPTTSAQVVSRDDDVTVRPGQSVEVRVLANDVDTGGGELRLEPLLEHAEGIDAAVIGRRVVVSTPREAGVLQIAYTATNARGGSDTAVLTVTVTPDAPILAPVAKDRVVPAVDTINRTTVEVDVLAVAENPSGPLSDLEVLVHPSAAAVASVLPNQNVLVVLTDRAQTLPYLLRNTSPEAGGVSSYAFITVPALGDFPPMPRPGADELVTVAGEPLEISLAEQVLVGPGRTARISDVSTVSATKSDGSPLVVSATALRYTPQRTYAGPASISFEVTDGGPQDPGVRTRVLTLPITVLAAEDHPPTFTPSVLDVGPGETTRVDLANFTSAPAGVDGQAQRYTYTTTSEPPSGFQVTLDGSVLSVTAGPTVPRATVGGVSLEIGYGQDGLVPAQVDFRVVASSRPLARVLDLVVPDGVEGGSSTLQVLSGAYNPFPESGLTVVGAVVETPGAGTAAVQGQQVTVRPGPGFIGQMVTRYRVRDVTGDADREVEGRITVTVRGRPSPPSAPRVVEVRDRTVVLAWDAPANNGEPITGYRLLTQPGNVVTECASTTCTVAGLTNDVEYTSTVSARNAVDWSDPSPPSAPARPDVGPAAPAAPQLVWGDASVTATWTVPENPGSPITRYEVQISPAAGGGADVSTSSTSYTFGRLTNGTPYAVRVRAVNEAPEPGDWSPWSTAEVPAAVPGAPSVSAARMGQGSFGGGWVEVDWPDAPANGDPVAEYQISVDGAVAITATSNRYVLQPASPGRHTFEVRARNKAGWGPWGRAEVTVSTVPAQMSAPIVDVVDGAGEVVLEFAAPDSAGSPITRYQVSVDGREPVDLARSGRVQGLAAGTRSFAVRACNEDGCGQLSPAATAAVTTPPGDVQQVVIRFDDDAAPATVTASWQPPSDTGGAKASTFTYFYRLSFRLQDPDDPRSWDPQGWQQLGPSAAVPVVGATASIPVLLQVQGGEVRVEVYAVNEFGGRSPADAVVTRMIAAPPVLVPPPTP